MSSNNLEQVILHQCSRKRVQHLKKRKKSRFLDFQKKRKKRTKRTRLVMRPLITNLSN